MAYFVYVLKSKIDNNIYIGITNNLERRVKQHNEGQNFSTKYRRPLELIHEEVMKDRIEARKREKFLKSGCGREFIKNIYIYIQRNKPSVRP